MYHERTQKEIQAARLRTFAIAFLIVLALIVCAVSVNSFQESSKAQSAASIRNTIITSAMQCYAIEGSYPSSFKHLKDTYGLTVNEDDYVIYYEWFADNLPPSVAVTAR